jgi:hypothetical protein
MNIIVPLSIASLFLVSCKPEKTETAAANTPAESSIPYPLDTCPVSGEKLGEMGKPYVFVHDGREIKLCCKNCLKDFNGDPAKFITKIDAAATKK